VTSCELRTWERIRDIGAPALSTLHGAGDSPFLSYDWLDALEVTGCVSEERGWRPLHLTLHRGSRLVGFAPAYLKGNSEGEFVFDHAFARFAEASLKIQYYPKLLVAVPFTPATGSRLLLAPGEDRAELTGAFVNGLRILCERLELSSAHVLFPNASESELLVRAGLARRTGVQFHWQNRGYATFDDFLGKFKSKRRHQIRRERREVFAQGIDVDVLTGSDLGPELADFVYSFYRTTVDKFFWGRRYLNRAFFEEVLSRLRQRVHLVVAKERASGRRIAGAFNLLSGDTLYGRYWGALEDRNFLHFEVCFYRGIEDAIARKLTSFEPGAGGEHKLLRGFEPAPTFSAHHLADPRFDVAARDFMQREELALDLEMREARQVSGLRVADESAEEPA
jgi:uncharacterized protein